MVSFSPFFVQSIQSSVRVLDGTRILDTKAWCSGRTLAVFVFPSFFVHYNSTQSSAADAAAAAAAGTRMGTTEASFTSLTTAAPSPQTHLWLASVSTAGTRRTPIGIENHKQNTIARFRVFKMMTTNQS